MDTANPFGALLRNLGDAYSRQARLLPALLAICPAVMISLVLAPNERGEISALVATIGGAGGTFLLAQLTRDAGKKIEPILFSMWGGKPSIAMLRHLDERIDPYTKAAHKAFLAKNTILEFPSPDEEVRNSVEADKIYDAATAWLISQTRDSKKFELLFRENIAYGFRRNTLGIRSIGLVISAICSLIGTFVIFLAYHRSNEMPPLRTFIATGICWIFLLWWAQLVRPSWVKVPADAYAVQLLSACSMLEGTPSKPTKARRRP